VLFCGVSRTAYWSFVRFCRVLVSLIEIFLFLLSEPGACGCGGGSFTGGAMGGGWLFDNFFNSYVFNRLAVSF
jgi:hypothetical protein